MGNDDTSSLANIFMPGSGFGYGGSSDTISTVPPTGAAPSATDTSSPSIWDHISNYLMGGAKPAATGSGVDASGNPVAVNPANQYLYQTALANGNYSVANSLAPSLGQTQTNPGLFQNIANVLSGQHNDQLNNLESGIQTALPFLMYALKQRQQQNFLNNNQSIVNGAAGGNIGAQRSNMPAIPAATGGF